MVAGARACLPYKAPKATGRLDICIRHGKRRVPRIRRLLSGQAKRSAIRLRRRRASCSSRKSSTTNLKFLSGGGPKPFRNKKAEAPFARPLLTCARRMLSPVPSRPRPVAAADARGCRYVSLLDTCVRGRLVCAPQARRRPQAGEEQPRVSRLGVARHGLRRRRARPPERLQFCAAGLLARRLARGLAPQAAVPRWRC